MTASCGVLREQREAELPYTPHLLDMVEARLAEICDRLSGRTASGDPTGQRMIAEGYLAGYQRALCTLRERRPALEQALAAH